MSSLKSLWIRDNKEIAYDPNEDLDKDTLIYTLQQLKVPQLQKNAIFYQPSNEREEDWTGGTTTTTKAT